jgi:hypothetical protein
MAVKYSLYPNKLNGNKGTYYAQVVPVNTVDINDIIKHVKSCGSSVSESDFLAVYHELERAIIHFLQEGCNVNTSLLKAKHSISGKFENFDGKFKKGENSINACFEPGRAIVKATKYIKVEKINPKMQKALILQYKDTTSGEINKTITPGGIGTIYGENLKVDQLDGEQGIFFIDQTGGKVKVEHIGQNSNTNLVFMNPPSLVSGRYNVEIIQKIKNNKTKRASLFQTALMVK